MFDADIHAVYLKSVRSPIQNDGFRLQARHYEKDVFSQVPEQDSEYEEDSFCVGEDFQETGEPPKIKLSKTACS